MAGERTNWPAGEETFRLVVESCPVGVVLVHPDGAIGLVNAEVERILGYARTELLGRALETLIPERLRDAHVGQREAFTNSLSRRPMGAGRDLCALRKDGTEVRVEIALHPMSLPDGTTAVLATVTDISERIRAAAELRASEERFQQSVKMEAVGQLTGGMAHDFNNLLTVVVGNLDNVIDGLPADSRIAPALKSALEAADRGAELTRQMLAFARRQTLEPTVLNVNQVIEHLQVLLARTLGEHIVVRTNLGQSTRNVHVDRSLLESALLNLAVNARDAMPDGGTLTFESEDAEVDREYAAFHDDMAPGSYVRVSVVDTGTGMPPEVVKKAFEPFFTTKEPGKGTGLGLAMVFGFARQSGGYVNIYSEVGHGTAVHLYLPVAKKGLADPVVREKAVASQRGNARVVVVEDEPNVRALEEQLRSLGYTVTAFGDGPSLLRAVAGLEVDLLVTDIVLPGGMNGREVANRLAVKVPGLRVLFSSGYSQQAMEEAGVLSQGIILLRKPYRRAALAIKVKEALDGLPYVPRPAPAQAPL